MGSSSCWSLFLVLAIITNPTKASISFIESGRSFLSRQDTNIGQPLEEGYQYMGRLQYIPENPTLCPGTHPNQKFDILVPQDGLPVALLAKSGGCSMYEKVVVASSLINPSNNVAYLIIEDATKRPHGLSLDEELKALPNEKDSQLQQFGDGLMKFLPDNDKESFLSLESMEFDLETAEQHGRALLELPKPESETMAVGPLDGTTPNNNNNNNQLSSKLLEINIAILHVSNGAGETMFSILDKDIFLEKREGGPRILLNGNGTSFNFRTVLFWMLATFSICACGCACLLICVQTELDEPEEPQPRRPVRRRLTLEEVRSRFPSYHFHPEDHTQNGCCPSDAACSGADAGYMQVSDECTICLDEFVEHVRVRKLPCGHVFHSTCIARWLVERNANCPLCKLDLYMEPEEDDESSNDAAAPQEPPTTASFWSRWFADNITGGGYSQLNVPLGAAEEAQGVSPNGAFQDEPRSWWPFSLETVPSADEDEQQQQDEDRPSNNNNNNNNTNSQSSPLSIAASALSSLWARNSSVFRRQRRRHRHEEATDGNLTELTEPLVPVSPSATEEPEGRGVTASSLTQESQPLVSESATNNTAEI